MKKTLAVILSAAVFLFSLIIPARADIVKGDVTGDGRISSADSLIVQRAAIGLIKLNDTQKEAADFNNDGRVTILDALHILRYTINLAVDIPFKDNHSTDTDETDSLDTSTDETDSIDTSTDETDSIDTSTDETDSIDTSTDETDSIDTSTDETDSIDTSTDETDSIDTSTDETDSIDTSTDETDSNETSTDDTVYDTPDTPDSPDRPDTPDSPDEPDVSDTDQTDNDVPGTDEPDTDKQGTVETDNDYDDTDETDTNEDDTDETYIDDDEDEDDTDEPMLYLPPHITINCGDRTTLNPKVINGSEKGLTYYFEYDGAISYDGTGETVLEVSYASGLLKGYHPGTDHVVVTASNGLTAECDVTVVNNKTVRTVHVGDHTLKITKEIMIYNDCYSESFDFTNIFGLVVHSTAEPGIKADRWYPLWNRGGVPACVHAFLDDEGVYQYLPFEQRGWHAGYPVNNTRLDFEICEPAGFEYDEDWNITNYNVKEQQTYFDKIWENATVFSAYLIYKYDIDEDNIISHFEAGQMGIGTTHGDPDHWFILHGKTMDDFREDVWKLLEEDIYETDETIICSLE